MASFRCRFSLGSERFVKIGEWKGELQVDIREWRDDKPTKKDISLSLMRWKNWVNQLEFAEKDLHEKKSYGNHMGGNVYCAVAENSVCVDIRQYWKPEEEVIPTKKGVCLRPLEYLRLKELLPEIGNVLPELNGVVPYFLQSDHMNHLGALKCSECNPYDFYNW